MKNLDPKLAPRALGLSTNDAIARAIEQQAHMLTACVTENYADVKDEATRLLAAYTELTSYAVSARGQSSGGALGWGNIQDYIEREGALLAMKNLERAASKVIIRERA